MGCVSFMADDSVAQCPRYDGRSLPAEYLLFLTGSFIDAPILMSHNCVKLSSVCIAPIDIWDEGCLIKILAILIISRSVTEVPGIFNERGIVSADVLRFL